jgi:hypothetical protein
MLDYKLATVAKTSFLGYFARPSILSVHKNRINFEYMPVIASVNFTGAEFVKAKQDIPKTENIFHDTSTCCFAERPKSEKPFVR